MACGFFKGCDYGKWEKVSEYMINRPGEKEVCGIIIIQKRICQSCGYQQYDKQRIEA